MSDTIKKVQHLLASIKALSERIQLSSTEENWQALDSGIFEREKLISELSKINIERLDTETAYTLRSELMVIKKQDDELKSRLNSSTKNLEGEILQTRKMGKAAKNYQS